MLNFDITIIFIGDDMESGKRWIVISIIFFIYLVLAALSFGLWRTYRISDLVFSSLLLTSAILLVGIGNIIVK